MDDVRLPIVHGEVLGYSELLVLRRKVRAEDRITTTCYILCSLNQRVLPSLEPVSGSHGSWGMSEIQTSFLVSPLQPLLRMAASGKSSTWLGKKIFTKNQVLISTVQSTSHVLISPP